ncbi:dihydrolipoyllysine-residue succinyltransferase component of 2-oxoglutarate dehydrogenase complex, mitochondrial isoform X2 [Culicoides brevitarsis]|uniref:dihydrolipoyllysine-residue succinyltransferase component of 2-oxoglutarate dehydrogenase complex, mitochondrial isoform X2 n=1 Tax=Culicoides brevitarsis TaxID=469753 RepID=UPI00307BAB3E
MAGILGVTRTLPRNLVRIGANSLKNSPQAISKRAVSVLLSNTNENVPSFVSSSKQYTVNGAFQSWRSIQTTAQLLEVVKVPPFADSVSEGDVRFTKKVGDSVTVDEVVMEIETDKTTVGVPSPHHGIIEEIFVADGDTVKAGQQLFKLKVTDGPVGGSAPAASAPAPSAPSTPPPSAPTPSVTVAPPAPSAVPPPPPPKPRAPEARMPVAAMRHAQAIDSATVKLPPADYSKEISGTRTEQRVKMNRMRLKIASRLKEAQNVNAMLTTFNEIDMSYIMEFRKQHQDAFLKKHGIKLGFMSAFCKAAAYALQDQPVVNAVIEENEIVYRDYVDISVAVASPKGLVVPVVRNCESMNYAEIELAINALGEKARKGTLAVEDMDGGTFTISNGGVFGSLMGTPIINPPQSAILGMHGTFERPIALKGQVVIRPMMYIALTYDHRLIDGREAVTFLRKIKAAVEDPRIMLAGL